MKFRSTAFLAGAAFWSQLFFAPCGYAEVIQTKEDTAPQQILKSVSGTQSLILVSFSPVIAEGKTLGAVLVYDNPKTNRTEDYSELYDNGGQLVAVAWFDRFGIQRIAVDRGLFEEGYALQGMFVTLLNGDPV